MIYLSKVSHEAGGIGQEGFPFNLTFVQNLKVEFNTPVTYLVGENGSGKSTFLESLGCVLKLPVVGSQALHTDPNLAAQKSLGRSYTLEWNARTKWGFFLRAEDFFGFTKKLQETNREMEQAAKEFESELSGYALQLAKGTVLGQKAANEARYGKNPDARSHGESFLHLFQQRIVPQGLYILDEPEAPLSPQRQLSLLTMIRQMTAEQECQFIIATHSPLLMALPEATILNFDGETVEPISFEETEHYQITKQFLDNPEMFLRHL